jgi:hypothetical protein
MRNIVTLVLAVWVAILTVLLYSQTTALRNDQREIRELSAKQDSISRVESLDLQEKCAKQAYAVFHQLGWDRKPEAVYQNHYDEKLNVCFIEVNDTTPKAMSDTVSDAFEGKVYAAFFQRVDPVKKYWQVSPNVCWVIPPSSGEEKSCASSVEFHALTKFYMP